MTEVAAEPEVGWRLRIRHLTGFTYAGTAHASYNEARLTPLTLPGQITLFSQVEVRRPPADLAATRTTGARRSTAFDLHGRTTSSRSTGRLGRRDLAAAGLPDRRRAGRRCGARSARDRVRRAAGADAADRARRELEAAALAAAADRDARRGGARGRCGVGAREVAYVPGRDRGAHVGA